MDIFFRNLMQTNILYSFHLLLISEFSILGDLYELLVKLNKIQLGQSPADDKKYFHYTY